MEKYNIAFVLENVTEEERDNLKLPVLLPSAVLIVSQCTSLVLLKRAVYCLLQQYERYVSLT